MPVKVEQHVVVFSSFGLCLIVVSHVPSRFRIDSPGWTENLSWISRALHEVLETAPQSLQVRLRMHVTQSPDSKADGSPGKDSSNTKEHPELDVMTEKLLENDRLSVESGRPNVYALLEEELAGVRGHVTVDGVPPNLHRLT
jgi:hypothetical protein